MDTDVSAHPPNGFLLLDCRPVLEIGHVLKARETAFKLIFLAIVPVIKLDPILSQIPITLNLKVLRVSKEHRVGLYSVHEVVKRVSKVKIY